jgi:hypothetical protein
MKKYNFTEVHQHPAGRTLPGKAKYHNPGHVKKLCTYKPVKIALVNIDEYDRTAARSQEAMVQYYTSVYIKKIDAQLTKDSEREARASALLLGIAKEMRKYDWSINERNRLVYGELEKLEGQHSEKVREANHPNLTRRLAAVKKSQRYL